MSQVESNQPTGRRKIFPWVIALLIILFTAAGAGVWTVQQTEAAVLETAQTALDNGQWAEAIAYANQALGLQPQFLRQQVGTAYAIRGVAQYHQNNHDEAFLDINRALESNPLLVDLYAYRSEIHGRADRVADTLSDIDQALSHPDVLPASGQAPLLAQKVILQGEQGAYAEVLTIITPTLALAEYIPAERLGPVYYWQTWSTAEEKGLPAAFATVETALAYENQLTAEQVTRLRALYALSLFTKGDTAGGLAAAEQVLAHSEQIPEPLLSELYWAQAQSWLTAGETSQAVETAAKFKDYPAAGGWQLALQAWQSYLAYDEAEALKLAEEAITAGDSSGLAHQVQGLVFYWQGRYAEAQTALEQALEANPAAAEAWLGLGLTQYALSQYDLWAETVQTAQEIAPNHPATLALQGVYRGTLTEFDQAKQWLDLAIEQEPGRAEFYVWRARWGYVRTADDEKMWADLNKALELYPGFPQAKLTEIFEANYEQEQTLYTEETVLALLEARPDWDEAHSLVINYYILHHQRDKAWEYLTAALEKFPAAADLWADQARYYYTEENYEEAQVSAEKVIELDPHHFSGLIFLAAVYQEKEQDEVAEQYLQQLLTFYPNASSARLEVARYYLRGGDYAQAMNYVEQALIIDPDRPGALTMRGQIYLIVGNFLRAARDLKRSLELRPQDSFTHLLLSQTYFSDEKIDQAKEQAQKALEFDRYFESYYAHMLLVFIALQEEDVAEAENQMALYAEKIKNPASFATSFQYEPLVDIYLELEQFDEVISAAEAGLELDENYAYLYYMRGLAHLYQGDEEAGKADLAQALELSDDIFLIADIEQRLDQSTLLATQVGDLFVFTSEEDEFQISYPTDWQQITDDEEAAFSAYIETGRKDGYMRVIVVPGIPINTSAVVDNLVDSYTESGAENLTHSMVQINGRSFGFIQYEFFQDNELKVISREYLIVRGGIAYLILLQTLEEYDEVMAEDFATIINSFTFLED